VNIKKARKLLGEKGKNLTDKQVMNYINDTRLLVDLIIGFYFSLPPEERKNMLKEGDD